MTEVREPGDPEDDHHAEALAMLSDEDLSEVVAEAVTSEDVSRAEAELLDPDGVVSSDKERIGQIEVDRRLVELLASTGYEGERFEKAFPKLSGRMISYAHPIIGLWVRDGRIFGECLKYRGRISPAAAAAAAMWTKSERDDAVLDTLVRGVDFFLEYGLRKGKWDHRRGATLATYQAMALNAVGWRRALLGDPQAGRQLCEQALAMQHDDPEGQAATLDSLGEIASLSGDHQAAVRHYEQALELRRQLGNTYEVARSLDLLGDAHVSLGSNVKARESWLDALHLYVAQRRLPEADAVRQRLADLSGPSDDQVL